MKFHTATLKLLGSEPRSTGTSESLLREAEDRLGFSLPPSVREWYSLDDAIEILAKYSNDDPPIPIRELTVLEWGSDKLLPFRNENQGVCTWAIMLDGSEDPPVYVDVDSGGREWQLLVPTFSAYVYSCVWDYSRVFRQLGLVQAQSMPLTPSAVETLSATFTEELRTHGWPGCTQYRFSGDQCAVLIWSSEDQADWFVSASDSITLEKTLKKVWNLDQVGKALYDCSDIGKTVLAKMKEKA